MGRRFSRSVLEMTRWGESSRAGRDTWVKGQVGSQVQRRCVSVRILLVGSFPCLVSLPVRWVSSAHQVGFLTDPL